MIFSLLKIGKKTSAVVAGIAIGAASLWGLSMWQDISGQEIFTLLGATVLFLLLIILLAICLITLFKLGSRSIARWFAAHADDVAAADPGNPGNDDSQESKP